MKTLKIVLTVSLIGLALLLSGCAGLRDAVSPRSGISQNPDSVNYNDI